MIPKPVLTKFVSEMMIVYFGLDKKSSKKIPVDIYLAALCSHPEIDAAGLIEAKPRIYLKYRSMPSPKDICEVILGTDDFRTNQLMELVYRACQRAGEMDSIDWQDARVCRAVEMAGGWPDVRGQYQAHNVFGCKWEIRDNIAGLLENHNIEIKISCGIMEKIGESHYRIYYAKSDKFEDK